MNKELYKAYEEVEMLKSLDLPVPTDKCKLVAQLEGRFVKSELIPFIQGMLKPLLEDFKGSFDLSVSYDMDKGIKVCTSSPKSSKKSAPFCNLSPITHNIVNDKCYFIHSGVVDASAHIEKGKIIVHRGSRVLSKSKPSVHNPEVRDLKLKTTAENHGEYSILLKDLEFNSVSTAAVFCLGRSANGWLEWKDENGKLIPRT